MAMFNTYCAVLFVVVSIWGFLALVESGPDPR